MTTPSKIEKTRPAEIGGISGSAGLLLARLFGVDDADTIVAIGVLVGFIPAAITYLVNVIQTLRD